MRGDPRAAPLVVVLETEADEMGFALEDRTREIALEVLAAAGDTPQHTAVVATSMDEVLDLARQVLAEASTE